MNTVKNLNVNTNAMTKKRKFRLIPLALATVLVATGVYFGGTKVVNAIEQDKIDTIVEYYEEGSYEDRILDYIDISEDLEGLDLDEYEINIEMYEKYNISDEIMTPEEIKVLIKKADKISTFTPSKDINKQCENIDTILNLKMQERLVNEYIYHDGYTVAHENITEAAKKYAAEVFGIDENNITFNHKTETSSGERQTTIINSFTDNVGLEQEQRYNIGNYSFNNSLNEIRSGVENMIKTDVTYDSNSSDNYEYNKERNEYIINALKQSVDMNTERIENDLYNEKLASKMM